MDTQTDRKATHGALLLRHLAIQLAAQLEYVLKNHPVHFGGQVRQQGAT